MSNKCSVGIMSKESTAADFVKQNQSALSKKAARKINKTKKEPTPQSVGRDTFEKEVKTKSSVIKVGSGDKLRRNGRNNKLKSDVSVEHNESADCASNFQSNYKGNCKSDNGNVLKQRNQNAPRARNKGSTGREGKVREDSECESAPVLSSNNEEKEVNHAHKTNKSNSQWDTFPSYITEREILKLLQNQNSADAQYVEGYLRINPCCYKYAYLSLPDDRCDLLILGLRDRNRAFDGDLVVACINPPEKWHSCQGEMQKTGSIVCIREKIHPRKTVGCIKQRGGFMIFYPRDQRFPLMNIHRESLEQFSIEATTSEDTLYLAVVTNWAKPKFAIGKIEKFIGSMGDLKAEANAILLEHDLDVTPYSQNVVEGLPDIDCTVTENDLKDREDWRQECVFTIDPDTAVDLDDAVSCKLLENGNYEIGVHISDVTHYLEFSSPLDIQVSKRATTVYMTDNVYHMLPKQLCQVCSLLPGQDKLAFSVIWEITPRAEVIKHRFAKTIIRSCCQMAYRHAQKFIENPKNNWPDDFLNINGDFMLDDLSVKVNTLHDIASQIRNERFQNGALRIDQPKLHVRIDRSTGLPISYSVEELQDSNRLIEEFMLLANMTVATHLYATIPETALLRNHKEPSKQILNTARDTLQKFGIHLDIRSSASLHASMKRYEEELESESNEIKTTTRYRMMVVNNLCSKAMARATYKCSSTVKTEEELKHYALNVSLYTHFTSPIRRYSDCVVHRLLHSTITNVELPKTWSKELCKVIAENCNVKKYSAKLAQERSNELYFTQLINLNGPIITVGIVLNVKENYVDVILCQIGIKLRVFFAELKKVAAVEYSSECSFSTISISWKQPDVNQVINIFTLLQLKIEKHPESFQLIGNLLPPTYEIES